MFLLHVISTPPAVIKIRTFPDCTAAEKRWHRASAAWPLVDVWLVSSAHNKECGYVMFIATSNASVLHWRIWKVLPYSAKMLHSCVEVTWERDTHTHTLFRTDPNEVGSSQCGASGAPGLAVNVHARPLLSVLQGKLHTSVQVLQTRDSGEVHGAQPQLFHPCSPPLLHQRWNHQVVHWGKCERWNKPMNSPQPSCRNIWSHTSRSWWWRLWRSPFLSAARTEATSITWSLFTTFYRLLYNTEAELRTRLEFWGAVNSRFYLGVCSYSHRALVPSPHCNNDQVFGLERVFLT